MFHGEVLEEGLIGVKCFSCSDISLLSCSQMMHGSLQARVSEGGWVSVWIERTDTSNAEMWIATGID